MDILTTVGYSLHISLSNRNICEEFTNIAYRSIYCFNSHVHGPDLKDETEAGFGMGSGSVFQIVQAGCKRENHLFLTDGGVHSLAPEARR